LRGTIDAIPGEIWLDDLNGKPGHRRHLARHFGEEIRIDLTGELA
jgi:hypothetical protein